MTELIDKRMLIDALNRVAMFHHETHIPMVEHDFRELIDNVPIVDAVEHSKWQSIFGAMMICPCCGVCISEDITDAYYDNYTELPNYCPNCGAKMDKEDGTK